jgi:hypothetical protein
MKSVTLAWWFETPKPLTLNKVQEALKPLGISWIERDCEWAPDSINGPLTQNASSRIFQFGVSGFVVNLTVEAESNTELEAKKKLLGEVLPLLDAREIEETKPEET